MPPPIPPSTGAERSGAERCADRGMAAGAGGEKRILCVGLVCLDVISVVDAYPAEDTDTRYRPARRLAQRPARRPAR